MHDNYSRLEGLLRYCRKVFYKQLTAEFNQLYYLKVTVVSFPEFMLKKESENQEKSLELVIYRSCSVRTCEF